MTPLNRFFINIKSLLYYFFDTLALLKKQTIKKNKFEVVLLIRQDAIGDFVMWLDTAKEYRKLYPSDKYKIILAGNKIWCELAEKLAYWDRVISVDSKQFKTFSNYRWNLLRKIRNLKIKTVIQPTFSREFYIGDALVRASGAPRKVSSVGDMSNRNWLKKIIADSWHTELISASRTPLTELERNAEFFSGLTNSKHVTRYPKLEIPKSWLPSEFNKKTFYILVPGSSGAVDGKEWPPKFFKELAKKVFQQTGWEGLICGSKQEHNLGEKILQLCDVPIRNFCGQTTLVELASLLGQSQLTISNDTGTVFLSSAVGTKSICILGGGHFGRFVPYPDLAGEDNNLQTVYHKMPCYGCNWDCIFTITKGEPKPCIANISVDLVMDIVSPLLINKTL